MGWFDSDDDDDKKAKKESSSKNDSPGPIGGGSSYGMSDKTFKDTIGKGRDKNDHDHDYSSKPSESIVDTVVDTVSDAAGSAWQGVKDWFGGKEDTGGFSPMGGASSYGMDSKTFDTTVGKRRHESRSLSERLGREIKYFSEAPMDYVSDMLDNPLINLGMALSGAGLTTFGIKAVDAVMDYFQGEASGSQATRTIAGTAISATPIGATLGPARQIVASTIKNPEAFAPTVSGMIGGKMGAETFGQIASNLTDNPYAQAAMTAAGAAGTAAYASNWVAERQEEVKQMGGTQTAQVSPMRESGSSRGESPLVSSGQQAVQASRQLMQQPDTDLYARTVKQLPFYGLQTLQQKQLPFMGPK